MRKETREDWERRVHRTLEKMTGSLDEAVLAEQFAGDAASSRWHFERAFRSLTGEPFASCVRRLRLERAAYRLQEGEPVLKPRSMRATSPPNPFAGRSGVLSVSRRHGFHRYPGGGENYPRRTGFTGGRASCPAGISPRLWAQPQPIPPGYWNFHRRNY